MGSLLFWTMPYSPSALPMAAIYVGSWLGCIWSLLHMLVLHQRWRPKSCLSPRAWYILLAMCLHACRIFCCLLDFFEGLQLANKKCRRKGFRWKISGIHLFQTDFKLKGKMDQVDQCVLLQEIGLGLRLQFLPRRVPEKLIYCLVSLFHPFLRIRRACMAWPNFKGRGLVGIKSVAANARLCGVQVKPFVGYC